MSQASLINLDVVVIENKSMCRVSAKMLEDHSYSGWAGEIEDSKHSSSSHLVCSSLQLTASKLALYVSFWNGSSFMEELLQMLEFDRALSEVGESHLEDFTTSH